jgi:hypothetical protein
MGRPSKGGGRGAVAQLLTMAWRRAAAVLNRCEEGDREQRGAWDWLASWPTGLAQRIGPDGQWASERK